MSASRIPSGDPATWTTNDLRRVARVALRRRRWLAQDQRDPELDRLATLFGRGDLAAHPGMRGIALRIVLLAAREHDRQ